LAAEHAQIAAGDNRLLTNGWSAPRPIIEIQKKIALLLGLPTVNDEGLLMDAAAALAPRSGLIAAACHSAGGSRAPACIAASSQGNSRPRQRGRVQSPCGR